MSGTSTPAAARCSAWARAVDLSPAGTIGSYRGFLLVEWPLPWPRDVGEIPELRDVAAAAGSLGYRIQALVPSDLGAPPGDRRVVLHAPDPAGDMDGGWFSSYKRYEAPAGRSLADTAERLLAAGEAGSDEAAVEGTDVLVCTHGRRDVCCGSRGVDLAVQLLAAGSRPGVAIRRTSHTGGHRFAPTFVVLPEGTAWAFADPDLAEQVVSRSGRFADVASRYRGCSGLPDSDAQTLESEVLAREGWHLLDSARRVVPAGGPASVGDHKTLRLEAIDATGAMHAWEATVSPGRRVPVPDCGLPIAEATKTETELVVDGLHKVAG